MKHYFIEKKNHPRLTLFFAGWGMDEHPFEDCHPTDSDLLVCYDYRSLDFDFSLLAGYRSIRIIAWSMGVWAASQVFARTHIPIKESIAVNGTMTPVNDTKGISLVVFEGTLHNLNEATLRKFFRRMCGSGEILNSFMGKCPQRPIEELKEELFRISEQSLILPASVFRWGKAIIGKNDLIFTVANQQRAWIENGTPIIEREVSHYSESLLKSILTEG